MNHTVENRFTVMWENHGQSDRFRNNFNYLYVNILTPESVSLMVKVLRASVPSPSKNGISSLNYWNSDLMFFTLLPI